MSPTGGQPWGILSETVGGGQQSSLGVHQNSFLTSLDITIVRQPLPTTLEFILREQLLLFRVIVDDRFDAQIQAPSSQSRV